MPQDAPEQTYYPGAKVRLIIRFDEFGQPTRLSPAPKKSVKNLSGVKDDRAPLTVTEDADAPPGVKRFLIGPATTSGVGAGTDQTKSRDGLTHELGGIIPKSAQWAQNGIRTADTLKVELKYIDCPIDPRTVRSCAIEFHLGTLRGEDYAAGVAGAHRPAAKGSDQGDAMSLIPDSWTDDNGVQRSNLRFQGWVDKWTVDWSESGEPIIQLDCRDNTSLVIGQDAPPKLVVSAKDPIDKAFATYLSHFPSFQGLTVEYRPAGDAPPVLKDVLAHTAFRPQLGPQPAQGAGSDKHSVWDYLTDIAGSVGHTLRIEGTTIIIQRARSLMSNASNARQDDPFKGRTVGGAQFNYRRFIYGRNVLKMSTSRNFAKSVPTNVEVRSYSAAKKTVLVSRFPLPPDRQSYAIPGDAGTDQKWLVIRVTGIEDPKTLHVVAQNVYESIGRNEMNIELTTRSLASFGGGNTDPDILDAKPGDSIELLVNREEQDEFSTVTRIENALISQQRNADFMQALGFSPEFSAAYSKAYTDAGFQTVFRVKTMQCTWALDQGVTINVNGVNYLEVRADKALPSDEEPAAK